MKVVVPSLLFAALLAAACGPAKTYQVAVVVKGDTGGWWERFKVGVGDAGTEFGVTATMVGPSDADGGDNNAQQQIDVIEDLIKKKVDAIGVVPAGAPDVLAAVLKKARDAGIVVLSHEGTEQTNTDWDVEAVDNNQFGLAPMKKLIDATGGMGKYALFVGGGAGHDYWAHVAVGYAQQSAPGLTLVSLPVGMNMTTGDTSARTVAGSTVTGVIATVCGENECSAAKPDCQCRKATEALLTQYPDLKGIVGFGSQAPIGAGMAAQGLSKTGLTVVGAAVPGQAKDLLTGGFVTEAYLWDPADSGYAVVAVAQKILKGDKTLSAGVSFPRMGTGTVDAQNHDIIFNKIQSITKDNAAGLAASWGL